MHLISAFIENPVKVSVAVILLAMFGLIALWRMPMQLAPDVTRPLVTITTVWPGASPHEIETEIINEQEEQLRSVEGVIKMTSESSDSQGTIELEFQVGADLQEAVLKVNSQLQQVRDYPIDAEKPVIRTSSNNDSAIAWFILSQRPPDAKQLADAAAQFPHLADDLARVGRAGNVGLANLRLRELIAAHPELSGLMPPEEDVLKLRRFAEDQIEASLERVSGVANANVFGGEDQELQLILDPAKLAARGLTMGDVRDALRNQNLDVSAGELWEGKRSWVVRTLGQFRSVQEVADQLLGAPDGFPVYVKDVGEVRLGYEKPDGFVRRFGVSNIAVNIQRESGANVLGVMEGVQAVVADLNRGLLEPRGLALSRVYDETTYIRSAIGLVNSNIIVGGALTVIALMLFLHAGSRTVVFAPLLAASTVLATFWSPWFFALTVALVVAAGLWFARGTLIVALAIVISIVGTFMILHLIGRTLNVISLAGLAFAVGMLVDNAVVMLENIFRHYQLGLNPHEAARKGASEVWGAVVASTLTNLAVFLPIVFLQGEAGQLFVDIALAISAAVGLSLFVCVVVVPAAAARILQSDQAHTEVDRSSPVGRILTGFGRTFINSCLGLNTWLLAHKARAIAAIVLLVGGSIGLTWWLAPDVEYLPNGNRNLVISNILPPSGYNIEQLADMGRVIEKELRPYWDVDGVELEEREWDYPAIADFFYVIRESSIFLGLRAQRELEARHLIDLIQDKLGSAFPGTIVTARQTSLFGRGLGGGRTIDIEISGPELPQLVAIGGQIMNRLRDVLPADTQSRPNPGLDLSNPELHVVAKPQQANQLGLTNSELGFNVNAIVDGAYIGDYFIGGTRINMVIRGSEEYRGNSQDLATQYIATPAQRLPVRLDAVADVKMGAGPEEIHHRQRQRAITIEVTPPDSIALEEAISRVQNQIIAPLVDSGELQGQYRITLAGTADKLKQTWLELRWNVVLAVLITYLLMAALFESWLHPLVIMFTVPLGAVGGVIALRLLSFYLAAHGEPPQTLDVLTMLGFVILIGTVVNNAILIVHQALVFIREHGMSVDDSVRESVRVRVRPIFMTATTAVVGLTPLVFFPGAGSELYRGLGAVLIGGVMVSTIFTLIVTPLLFVLVQSTTSRVTAWYRKPRGPRGPVLPRVRRRKKATAPPAPSRPDQSTREVAATATPQANPG